MNTTKKKEFHRYLNMNVEMDLQSLIPVGQKPVRGEYLVNCPLCEKYLNKPNCKKLYIKDTFETGYCHRCGSKFHSPRPDPNSGNWVPPGFTFESSDNIIYQNEEINCEYYNKSETFSNEGLEYLKNRGKYLSENYLSIGFKFRNNAIVIPFKKDGNGDVFFYQCRFINPKDGRRYFIPPSDNKPLYIAPNSDLNSTKIILSEGIFGSLAIGEHYRGYKSIATLGSTITGYQLFQLNKQKITEIVLYYDKDEINEAVFGILKKKFPFCKYSRVSSPCEDPEDDLKNGVSPEIVGNRELTFHELFELNFK